LILLSIIVNSIHLPHCANEGEDCYCTGKVYMIAVESTDKLHKAQIQKQNSVWAGTYAGSIPCSTHIFGDVWKNVEKKCYCEENAETTKRPHICAPEDGYCYCRGIVGYGVFGSNVPEENTSIMVRSDTYTICSNDNFKLGDLSNVHKKKVCSCYPLNANFRNPKNDKPVSIADSYFQYESITSGIKITKTRKRLPAEQGCYTLTAEECCNYIDGRSNQYSGQLCMPSSTSPFTKGGNVCEPKNWIQQYASEEVGTCFITTTTTETSRKRLPAEQGCYTLTAKECCNYIDGRSNQYSGQLCMPSSTSPFTKSGNVCEPKNWVQQYASKEVGTCLITIETKKNENDITWKQSNKKQCYVEIEKKQYRGDRLDSPGFHDVGGTRTLESCKNRCSNSKKNKG